MQSPATVEQKVWEGSPSQWLNFSTFLIYGLGALLTSVAAALVWFKLSTQTQEIRLAAVGILSIVLAGLLIVIAKKYLTLRCTRYLLTTQRVRVTTGIFSIRTEDTELYRVDDIKLERPFLMRLVGLGNLVLVTSDRTTPNIVLKAISRSDELREQIRVHVEECRERKQTRVLDMVN